MHRYKRDETIRLALRYYINRPFIHEDIKDRIYELNEYRKFIKNMILKYYTYERLNKAVAELRTELINIGQKIKELEEAALEAKRL